MEYKQTCPKCGRKLPLFNEGGQHNFCPSSEFEQGKIVDLCMKCKMEEVVALWHGRRPDRNKG